MDLQRLRAQEFPSIEERPLFSHAATSPLSRRAAAAMARQIHEPVTLGSVGYDSTINELGALLEALP